MELEIFTLADFATDQGGKLTVVGTFDTIYTTNVPAVHPSCYVAIRLRLPNKAAGVHTFEIRGLTPDGKIVAPIKQDINILPNPNAEYCSANIVVMLNGLPLEKFGRYAFELYFDNEFKSGLSMHIVQVPIVLGKAA